MLRFFRTGCGIQRPLQIQQSLSNCAISWTGTAFLRHANKQRYSTLEQNRVDLE